MRRSRLVSAIGITIVVHPEFGDAAIGPRYIVACFNGRGDWETGSVHPTAELAKKERARMFAHHRKLAKKYPYRARRKP